MCGICGLIEREGVSPDPGLVTRMNDRLMHRGPDGGGQWIQGRAAIAMRRLAIIDLQTGQQPMFNETGEIGIVFNGEIYNYHELRADLEARGHKFASQSDTESIVHLYEEYGVEGIGRLNGMFAFAIWDSREQCLVLARDRAGKKPVYYAPQGGGLAFSSEIRSLLEFPGISRDIDVTALDNYFAFGYVPAPLSIFEGIRQLEPGHVLVWRRGQLSTRRYWRLRPARNQFHSRAEAAGQLYGLLEDAVRIRLNSDVPFGALLSGGVDSSLVVGMMSQLMTRRLKTFTIGFEDTSHDESAYAEEVARLFGTEHHNLRVGATNVVEVIEMLAWHFGEPFADASAIPTYLVSHMARQHVTMALSGDGGDEVFGGYRSYGYHHSIDQYRRAPGALRAAVRLASGAFAGARPGSLPRRARRFVEEAELPVNVRWAHSRGIYPDQELAKLYTPATTDRLLAGGRGFHLRASFDYFLEHEAEGGDTLGYVDYETYLPGDILVKTDRTSMATSLELRAPLLDYRLAEFAAGLPRSWKWNGRTGKLILKEAAAKLLPRSILDRRKQGFMLPFGDWFRGELVPYMKDKIATSTAGDIIRLDHCEDLLREHRLNPRGDFGRRIWAVLCFLIWHERFQR